MRIEAASLVDEVLGVVHACSLFEGDRISYRRAAAAAAGG